jgi:hypothetical protein
MTALSSRAGLSVLALFATMLSTCATPEKRPEASNPTTEVTMKANLTWTNVPTQVISAEGVDFAYRELGQSNGGTPIIFLNHLAGHGDQEPRAQTTGRRRRLPAS